MISRELLSEVLGIDVIIMDENTSLNPLRNNIVFRHNNLRAKTGTINIHELAHKVKEWAWDNYGIFISSHIYYYDGGIGANWSTHSIYPKNFNEKCGGSTLSNNGGASSEPEAIFKAGQWILENKEK